MIYSCINNEYDYFGVWLLNLLLKRMKLYVAIMLWCSILCQMWVLPLKTNRCTFLHTKETKRWRKALKPKPLYRTYPRELSGSKFVPTCHHYGVIGHIRPQCPKLKREQTHVTRSLSKGLVDLNTLFVTIVVPLVILDHIGLSFKL